MKRILTQAIGDTKTHAIPLSWDGYPFSPGNDWVLLFTAKSDPDTQTDDEAVFQKTYPDGGISVTGSRASMLVLPQDTEDESPGLLYWDIQATHSNGERRTVANGTLSLKRDVGRNAQGEPELDVHTVAPPLLYFSYQSYLANPTDDPPLTEEEWVSSIAAGGGGGLITSTLPPLPENGYPAPHSKLQWFDPSDGSTSVWMWLNDEQTEGVFVSQFPTPPDVALPDNAIVDDAGNAYVDESDNYYATT